jgi:uncharacterized cupredoxin-like copper-binding protein
VQVAQSGGSSTRRLAALATVVGVAVLASACGATTPTPPRDLHTARITESDFRIKAPPRLDAGPTVFRVVNRGPDDHELIVVRAQTRRLPLRDDGLTVDEDALESVKVGTLEPGEPHAVRLLHLKLTPGTYELFCNMAGHFFGGMHAKLVVQ